MKNIRRILSSSVSKRFISNLAPNLQAVSMTPPPTMTGNTNISEVIVRDISTEAAVQVSVIKDGKVCMNLSRDKQEALAKTFARVRKKWKLAETDTCEIRDPGSTTGLDESTVTNGEGFAGGPPGRILALGDMQFPIRINPPAVVSVRLGNWPLVGLPQMATVQVEFANPEKTMWKWLLFDVDMDSDDEDGYTEVRLI